MELSKHDKMDLIQHFTAYREQKEMFGSGREIGACQGKGGKPNQTTKTTTKTNRWRYR